MRAGSSVFTRTALLPVRATVPFHVCWQYCTSTYERWKYLYFCMLAGLYLYVCGSTSPYVCWQAPIQELCVLKVTAMCADGTYE